MTTELHPSSVSSGSSEETGFDPALMAVISSRLDMIVREMMNTLLRAGRSSVINVARDFSCSIVTNENELLASAEGLPVHVFGAHLQAAEMQRRHPDFKAGDAFLDNDPYRANSHQGDHTILVPVFVGDRHMFTAVAKAHQADIGNSIPASYHPFARDLYEEGALTFPCVKVQDNYADVEDIIEMCRLRIRVPDQWFGDYLASLGAARTGERRLQELVERYGIDLIERFVREWLDYSERRMDQAIRQLPSGRYERTGQHDTIAHQPRIPLKIVTDVDADAGRVTVDLRDNPDCVPTGFNLTKATATNMAVVGVFNNLDPEIPHNSGSFRRIEVLLRENCVVGIPLHPACTSLATTNVADRLVNLSQAALEGAGEEYGVAEGGASMGAASVGIFGIDFRTNEPYVNQISLGSCGGPATAKSDGWLTWGLPVCAGLMYRDSVEIVEQKYPLQVEKVQIIPDSGGAGRFRGAPGVELAYRTRANDMSVVWATDMCEEPAHGIHGGRPGSLAKMTLVDRDGGANSLESAGQVQIEPGQVLNTFAAGGGGAGDPHSRDPQKVRDDVLEGYVTRQAAKEVYGVVLTGEIEDESLSVDSDATRYARSNARLDVRP